MLTAFTVALIVALILLVVLIDILRASLAVNTLLAAQVMIVAKEGQVKTIHGPIKPRPGTSLLGRIMHHVDGKLHERMIRRAYFRAAPVAGALRTLRTKAESRSSNSND
jgi:hypothetical protein